MRGCSVGTAKERRQGSVSTEPGGSDAGRDAGTARAQLVSHVQCLSSAFPGPVCSPRAKSWLRYKGPMGCHSLICSTNIYQVFSKFWALFR